MNFPVTHHFCQRRQTSKPQQAANVKGNRFIFFLLHTLVVSLHNALLVEVFLYLQIKRFPIQRAKVVQEYGHWCMLGRRLKDFPGFNWAGNILESLRYLLLQLKRSGQTLQICMEQHKCTCTPTHPAGALEEKKEQKLREVHLCGWPWFFVPG